MGLSRSVCKKKAGSVGEKDDNNITYMWDRTGPPAYYQGETMNF